MDPDQFQKLMKRVAIGGSFFVLALVFYLLGWRRLLIGYAMFVTVVMVLAILLQSGKGGGLASLGGMGGENLLGARAATPIAKATYVMGALFLFICMLVSRLGQIEDDTGVGTLPSGGGRPPVEQVEDTPAGATGGGTAEPGATQPGTEGADTGTDQPEGEE